MKPSVKLKNIMDGASATFVSWKKVLLKKPKIWPLSVLEEASQMSMFKVNHNAFVK